MTQTTTYRAGLYCRLSKDDEQRGAYAGPVVQAFRRSWCIDSGHVVHAFR